MNIDYLRLTNDIGGSMKKVEIMDARCWILDTRVSPSRK